MSTFLPYASGTIPAVARVIYHNLYTRNPRGFVSAMRCVSPIGPFVTISGKPFPRTLVEAAVKRGALQETKPPARKNKRSGRKNPTHTKTCGTCKGKGCRRCGGQGWRAKNPNALADSAEAWVRSMGLKVPARGSAAWKGMFSAWQKRGMARNPSATTKLHGLIYKGQAALRGKNPGPLWTTNGYVYELKGRHSWLSSSDEHWETVVENVTGQFIGSRFIDGSRVDVVKSGGRYFAALPHAWQKANPGRRNFPILPVVGGLTAAALLLPKGHRGKFKNPGKSRRMTQAELAKHRAYELLGQHVGSCPTCSGSYRSLGNFDAACSVGRSLADAARGHSRAGAQKSASAQKRFLRRPGQNPSFDYGPSFHEMVLKSPARLSAGTGASCKRCKGVGQVKLGPRMVSCPTCCRKAKNPLTRVEAAKEIREIRFAEKRKDQLLNEGLNNQASFQDGYAHGVAGVIHRKGPKAAGHATRLALGYQSMGRKKNPLLSHKPNCACIYHSGKMGRKH